MRPKTGTRRRASEQGEYRVRVFKNGGSQAIRIPKALRVDSDEVIIRKVGEQLVVAPVHAGWGTAFSEMFFKGASDRTFPSREQPDWMDWKAGR